MADNTKAVAIANPDQSAEHADAEDTQALFKDGVHRVFHWMTTNLGEENDDVAPKKVVDSAGVPQRVLLEHIKSEIEEEASFLSLPFALLLVIAFAVTFILHDQASVVRDIEDAITFDIEENANFAFSAPGFMGHKAIYDVNSYADFYSWLRLGLRPLVLSHYQAQPEDYTGPNVDRPMEERRYYLNYNRIIGGVLLQQVRAEPVDMPDTELEPIYGKKIVPFDSAKFPLDLHHKPEIYDIIMVRPQYDDSKRRWFLLTDKREELDRKLWDLEKETWLTEDFVQANVNFMVFNAHFNTLTYTSVNFLQSRSGHLWRSVTHETLHMQQYGPGSGIANYIFDIIFVLQITWIFLTEVKEMLYSFKMHLHLKKTPMSFWKEYLGVWNCVDWASIILGYVLVVLFINFAGGTKDIRNQLINMPDNGDTADLPKLTKLFEDFKVVSAQFHDLRYLCVVYPLVIMCRLFKAFSAQPRLALVTRTLSTASVDVAHFGIVFFAIFFSYAVMGNALFGREVDGFSNIQRSINTCFLVLMGDFDVESMQQVGRVMTGVWFWSFMILVLLIMLNMLLAIIMDTYTNVKGQISSSETLCEQASELVRRWLQKRRGHRVSLHHIEKSYVTRLKRPIHEVLQEGDAEGDKVIGVKDFISIVPGLGERQAQRLLESSVKDFKLNLEAENPLSLSEAMGVISKIYQKLDHHIADWKKKFEDGSSPQKETKFEMMKAPMPIQDVAPAPAPFQDTVRANGPPKLDGVSTADLPGRIGEEYELGILLKATQVALRKRQMQTPDEPGYEVLAGFLRTAHEAWQRLGDGSD